VPQMPSEPCPVDATALAAPATLVNDLVLGAADAILALDAAGRVLFWNRGAELLFGWSSQEILGQPATALLPPDRVEEFDRVARALLGTAELAAMETVRINRAGERLPVSCRISPLIDSAGQVYGASAIVRDNSRETELRKQLEQAQQLAEARFTESVVAQASMDPDGTVIAVNPNTVQLGLQPCSLAICLVLGGRSRSRIVACRTWCRSGC
jgi:PAS domain S-box-containing protein